MAKIIVEKKVAAADHKTKLSAFDFFIRFYSWFVVIVCVSFLGFGYWYLLKPKISFIMTNQDVLMRDHDYIAKSNYLRQMNEIGRLYGAVSAEDKQRIDYMLSAEYDLDGLKIILLREIGSLGNMFGVVIDDPVITPVDNSAEKLINITSVDRGTLAANIKIVEVSFTASNVDYVKLKQILGRLERNLRLMDITQLEFDPAVQQAKATLMVYYKAS